ncbi:unnamed protein product [Didymodactylos carnosus]|uniref:Uncharacterized protein n=1 Tax=Didymodactylos carnosus TaxID=1234261 RepID=A0A814XHB3_9BILA|nr:unnamed protein product [Didymodactylos carnosus]CAF1211110.1 unnamed protein product [Didymodactylos carnosus]CAF3975085.1 unnamed protein product [Didymodactylos carnosus]CAF4014221.1 unnamed protein product [Didymodactylos carnosus]
MADSEAKPDVNGKIACDKQISNSEEPNNEVYRCGQAILRAKTSLIKPYSKYTEEGYRPRTPNDPYTVLTNEQVSNIQKDASSLFFGKQHITTATGAFRQYRQRHGDTFSEHFVRGSTQHNPYVFLTAEPHSSQLNKDYNGSTYDTYPKWYPNKADDSTWYNSTVPLDRRRILDDIQPKTKKDYADLHNSQRERYQTAKSTWPHLSEYGDQFVLKTKVQQMSKTELQRAKEHIGQNPLWGSSYHNKLSADAVSSGKTLVNEPPLVVKC